jgi:hypothetical protein
LIETRDGGICVASGDEQQVTEHKTYAKPDETREFPRGRAEILRIGTGEGGASSFNPGGAGRTT